MQLRSKIQYTNRFFTLYPGEETTNRLEITEEQKQYLIDTFPCDFEIIEGNIRKEPKEPETKELEIETPEAKLKISGLEDNLKIETKQVGRPKKVK